MYNSIHYVDPSGYGWLRKFLAAAAAIFVSVVLAQPELGAAIWVAVASAEAAVIGDQIGAAAEGRRGDGGGVLPGDTGQRFYTTLPNLRGVGQAWTNFATNPLVSQGASFVSGFVPIAGEAQDFATARYGVDVFTGEQLPWGWRAAAGATLFVPFVGAVQIRQGGRALNKLIAEGRAAGKLPSDAIEGVVNAAEEIYVIGTRADTKVAKFWPRHVILDLPDKLWRPFINDRWIDSIIEAGAPVYLASPLTVKYLWRTFRNRPTMYGQEVKQLVKAGYRLVGDYLIKIK